MKRIIVLCFLMAAAASTAVAASSLPVDDYGVRMQIFAPDPAKSQVTSSMTGTITFTKGAGGTVDITGWRVIQIVPTADGTYYFNSDTTKTFPIYGGQINTVFVGQLSAAQSVTFVLGSATASVQGM